MAKYLRDVSLGKPSGNADTEWPLTTNFLEQLYLDSLPKLETNGISKVVVTPCKAPAETTLKLLVNPDVLKITKQFDFNNYSKADKETRKKIALDFLQESLLEVAKIKHWDTKPLKEAYAAVLAKNLISERPWSKAVIGPDKRTKAQVWCRYDSDKADIFVVFSARGNIDRKTFVVSVKPGNVWIYDAIGALEWASDNTVRLISRNKAQSWEVVVPNLEL